MADLLEISLQLNTQRQVIHVDMDAFYAQVEMRDHPEYHDKQLILASDPRKNGGRGVVATANYAARKMGVHSAMSAMEALKLAPDALFIKPDFKVYGEVSAQVHEIFHRYTDMVEPIASDEAFLDVTVNKLGFTSAVALAHHMQQTIFDELHLTSSVGVSFNKFLAKLASEHNKPAGFTFVGPGEIREFLDPLPIGDIRGVGKQTEPRMHELGIDFGKDLYDADQSTLLQHFGKMGYEFYRRIRGVDDREVEGQRERKSIGNERTYGPFLTSEDMVLDNLYKLAELLEASLKRKQMHGKTIVIKTRNADFVTETRRRTEVDFIENDARRFYDLAQELFEELGGFEQPIRLLGLTMTGLAPVTFENLPLNLYQ
ncbi:MAG: DNA polymerase IV [Lactobacillaceae bacterium]|jgi:DNA polymerase-4|nr:DNA polymerase IV [Lactobacillaceae bacterium]